MSASPFPDDDLRRALQRLVRLGGLLEPHEHAGMKVSLSEMMALGELSEVDAMSQLELGRVLGLEKSTVSRLAVALERRGWIARERDPSNRRISRLQLTNEGRRVADLLGADLRARHHQLLGALSQVERDALAVGLAGLTRVLESQLHPALPRAGRAASGEQTSAG
jgi:DNA-binding MarR family transcriptional regulator